MTSEEYLKARGWAFVYQIGTEPRWQHILHCHAHKESEALTIQVRRDRDCAAFVAAYQEEPL